MSSLAFAAASSQRLTASGTVNLGTGATEHTCAALVTVASLPGAGVYRMAISEDNATTTRNLGLHLNGDTGPGTLSLLVGTTRVVPSSNMIPSTDGRWYLIGATKATGTVAVNFFMYDYVTGTWTWRASSGTVAARTTGATTCSVGSQVAGSFWDGRIGAAMLLPIAITEAQAFTLTRGRGTWRNLFSMYNRRQANGAGHLLELSEPLSLSGMDDVGSATILFNVGTTPTLDASTTPPGW